MQHRLYAFVINLYMSQIQLGIQSGHAATALSVKYRTNDKRHKAYLEWAPSPTILICGSMNLRGVLDKAAQIERLAEYFNLPWSTFHEDEDSLGGIMTCAAVLVPEGYFGVQIAKDPEASNSVKFIGDSGIEYTENTWPLEHEFLSMIKLARLA